MNDIVSSARERAARLPSLLAGPTCPDARDDGRVTTSSASKSLMIAPYQDKTARHFFEYCRDVGHPLDWICHDDLAWGRIGSKEVARICDRASGIYLRETMYVTQQEVAVASCLRALASTNANILGCAPASTNWSKPLHLLHLSREADVDCSVTEYSVQSRLDCSSGNVRKGLSGVPTFVGLVDSRSKHSELIPSLLQPYLDGREIRIHVVDDKVFAHQLTKKAGHIDYRVGGLSSVDPFELDDRIAAYARRITRREQLRFSGIDAISVGDALRVLEVNPMPGYHSFELSGGRPYAISAELISVLSGSRAGLLKRRSRSASAGG